MPARSRRRTRMSLAAAVLALMAMPGAAQPPAAREEVMPLWPGAAPGLVPGQDKENTEQGQSGDKRIVIKRDVSIPTLTVVRPARERANGTSVIVLPGGAFKVLVWDLEGTEVARWLADRGITVFILKYRVGSVTLPPELAGPSFLRALEPGRKIAIADASQAVRMVRQNAARYGVKPDRIGMMGFSAGGIATLGVLLQGDPAARPDFAASIYGMAMIDAPIMPLDAPPIFIAHAQDDPIVPASAGTQIMDLWTKVGRPAELHIYDKGGHGFGMRATGLPVDHWPTAFEAWLRSRDLLTNSAAP